MIIVASGAYVGSEFQAELGRLPPAFLPIGNKRLFQFQVDSLKKNFLDEKIVVSVPDTFALNEIDIKFFDLNQIELVVVPEHLSLSQSLLYVVNCLGLYNEGLKVLHGDTLLGDYPMQSDVVAIAETYDEYEWEVETGNQVWCGFFSFSCCKSLVRHLAKSTDCFVKAVREYTKEHDVEFHSVKEWLDLGHINTYYKSRSTITTQRSFNSLHIEGDVVTKSGTDHRKIAAELNWFNSIPWTLKRYTPQILDSGVYDGGEPYYRLEYLYFSPLNEVFVHGANGASYWSKLFQCCKSFFRQSIESGILLDNEVVDISKDWERLVVEKTYARMDEYKKLVSIDFFKETKINGCVLPSLNDVVADCIEKIISTKSVPGVMHGDFCLSNMLFDNRSKSIKVIDPRGVNVRGELSILGDLRYDLAKLSHSIIGMYDFIIAGNYSFKKNDEIDFSLSFPVDSRVLEIQKDFLQTIFLPEFKTDEIFPLTVLLFISMLPLHADVPERQHVMLANALKIYNEYVFQSEGIN